VLSGELTPALAARQILQTFLDAPGGLDPAAD
jgi:hypothetical protein